MPFLRFRTVLFVDVNERTWGYHSLGTEGWRFAYLLFADHAGECIESCRATVAVSWIRLMTDVPTGVLEILKGRQNWIAYLKSLNGFHVVAVFSREDPLPGLVELALFPYLCVKQGL